MLAKGAASAFEHTRETTVAADDFRKALSQAREIQITVTGRRSGRQITIPVWFVLEGERLYLLPLNGSDTEWFKNVRKKPTIRLAFDGKTVTAQATPIVDPARVVEVVEAFRRKYGAEDIRAYYSKMDAAVEVPLD
jgi:deazaflavin-dependent oxidoreductase (nitroreductase family)